MIYIIYDTALNGPYTLMLLQSAYPVNYSLFKGTKDEKLSDVAPYLFEVDENLFEKINSPLVSLKAVVIVESGEKIKQLLSHFQQFIYIKKNRQEYYFRFWDARVLARFLPSASDEKRNDFFNSINSFYVLDMEKATTKKFILKRGKLQTSVSALQELFVVENDWQQGLQNDDSVLTGSVQEKKPKRKFFS